jgi:hypothetical protein
MDRTSAGAAASVSFPAQFRLNTLHIEDEDLCAESHGVLISNMV